MISVFRRGLLPQTVRPPAGSPRDPVHRGVLPRFPPQEDRGRGHQPPGRPRSPYRDGGGAAAGRPGTVVPVSFKVGHELRANESDPKLADLVAQLEDCVEFEGRRVLYQWIGGTRSDWRGQGHFRALTEEQEVWALGQRLRRDPRQDEEQVLRDARRAGAAQLRRHPLRRRTSTDNRESKVFLSKRLGQHVVDSHRSRRMVTPPRQLRLDSDRSNVDA